MIKLSRNQMEFFYTNGYLPIPGVVPDLMVREALKAINHSIGQGGGRIGANSCKELQQNPVITDLFNRTPAFPILKSLLGPGSFDPVTSGQIAIRFPGYEHLGEPEHGHLDGLLWLEQGEVHSFTALVGILLSDLPEPGMGNFTAWPGTHREYERYFRIKGADVLLTEEAFRTRNSSPNVPLPAAPVQIVGKAGDLILVHYQTLHEAGYNASHAIRSTCFFRIDHRERKQDWRAPLVDIWKHWPGVREMIPAAGSKRERFSVPFRLSDPSAGEPAKRLMSFLRDQYGKRTLAGQQLGGGEGTEPEVLFAQTGRYPALLGFDFMDYSPSRLPFGTNGRDTDHAIRWWKSGGIVTFCWHWNAPKDLPNELPDRAWYSGFYTRATTFDLEKAMNEPDSEDYALLLRDIDAIAEQLNQLQLEGVPVLWRPLHEASGGWFWWGAKGPEPCIKLWQLLFDRLTNLHGLHNLIWVWNGQHKDWYPGDDVVDIIGEDVYGGARRYGSQIDRFRQALSCTEDNKIIALTENGTIPDPDELIRDEAPWSWFCTWCGGYAQRLEGDKTVYSDEHTETKLLRKVYGHPTIITKDQLPDLRTYPIPEY